MQLETHREQKTDKLRVFLFRGNRIPPFTYRFWLSAPIEWKEAAETERKAGTVHTTEENKNCQSELVLWNLITFFFACSCWLVVKTQFFCFCNLRRATILFACDEHSLPEIDCMSKTSSSQPFEVLTWIAVFVYFIYLFFLFVIKFQNVTVTTDGTTSTVSTSLRQQICVYSSAHHT